MEENEREPGKMPDIASMVSLIMQNPTLMEELRSLGRKAENSAVSASADPQEPTEPASSASEPVPTVKNDRFRMNGKRERLLSALKPYLSKERAGAIDAAIAVARIVDTVRIK